MSHKQGSLNNGKLDIFNAFAKDNEVHNKLVSMI